MTLNELLTTIKDGAGTAGEIAMNTAYRAGKKVSEVYAASKRQVTIFDLKNDINELYKEIGALVYATHKKGEETAEQIEERLLEIDEKMARIREIRAQIDEITKGKRCEKCGTRSEKSAAFCKKCGEKILK